MSQHAIYAPSSAKRWINCTASAHGIDKLPDAVKASGDEAEEGTRAHDEIERILGPLNGEQYSGGDFIALPNEIDYEHPASYGIAMLVDYVRQLPTPATLYIEQRVSLTADIWGRCDVAHWQAETATLTIIDYKNGFLDVQAEENEQLQIYAAAACRTFKLDAKWIRLVVVQPNSFMPVPRVKQWIMPALALHKFVERIAGIPQGALTFTPGQEQCRDCPLFGMCPPTKDLLLHFGTVMGKPAVEVPAEKIALYKSLEKPIEHFFKALHKHGTKLATTGNVPPGMKLVTATKHRDWKPDIVDALKESIADTHGIMALELPSPTQCEDRKLVTAEQLAEFAVKPEGGPALAFESDKRPAWAFKRPAWAPRSTEAMFAGVTGK